MPKFRIKKKRKQAKASSKSDKEAIERLGGKVSKKGEKKLFKQNLHSLKAQEAKGQMEDLLEKGTRRSFRKAGRKQKKYNKQIKKMFKS